MKQIICFGEIMLRLNPEGYLRLRQARRLELSFAGGEANVAVSLANYGENAAFVTKLPPHELAQAAIRELRGYGVDTTHVVWGGERMGAYFVEKGASQRPSKVIYDRKASAVSLASPADFDWDAIFAHADWFHFTGITPALSDALADICLTACRKAKARGLTVSCDLNYRKNLWTGEKAGQVMRLLMPFVDLCIANEEDAAQVFGIHAAGSQVEGGKLAHEGYRAVAETLCARFGCKQVAITLRESVTANDNCWSAMLYTGEACCFSKQYAIHIVDRVGGGDSFGGALIYALGNGSAPQRAIDFAAAASCLKHTVEFDYNQVTADEVWALVDGDDTGRVKR